MRKRGYNGSKTNESSLAYRIAAFDKNRRSFGDVFVSGFDEGY